MERTDVVHKVLQVLDAQADDPAAELIRLGEALIAVGKALHGLSTSDARRVVESVAVLEGMHLEERS